MFYLTAKLTPLFQHNVVDVDPMVLNVLMFIIAQITNTQWEARKTGKTSMSKVKIIQISRQKISLEQWVCVKNRFFIYISWYFIIKNFFTKLMFTIPPSFCLANILTKTNMLSSKQIDLEKNLKCKELSKLSVFNPIPAKVLWSQFSPRGVTPPPPST